MSPLQYVPEPHTHIVGLCG